jgi:hypothetical protein
VCGVMCVCVSLGGGMGGMCVCDVCVFVCGVTNTQHTHTINLT